MADSGVLLKQECAAGAKYDMVGLKFGPHRFLLYYQTSFDIAAGILMSAKLASAYEGVRPEKWSDMVNLIQQNPFESMHNTYRRSEACSNIKSWKLSFELNLVVFQFDEVIVKMHYSDALQMYGQLRTAAKNAKRWSGDKSRQWTTRAVLSDAEANDKILYVQ